MVIDHAGPCAGRDGVPSDQLISSSAHFILVPALTGWPDQGLAIDVAMHIGTLAAVLAYFRDDVAAVGGGAMSAMRGRWTPDGRLSFQIAAATVPVVIAGFLLKDMIDADFRNPELIAATTGGFAVLLWLSDRCAREEGAPAVDLRALEWRTVLLIGIAQALALVPGVSRSGITITAALFLGLGRTEAARFSLLPSIPTTADAGVLGASDLFRSGDAALQGDALIAGSLAFAAALAAIAGLMAWLKSAAFTPFVIYRLFLAAVLLGMIYCGLL